MSEVTHANYVCRDCGHEAGDDDAWGTHKRDECAYRPRHHGDVSPWLNLGIRPALLHEQREFTCGSCGARAVGWEAWCQHVSDCPVAPPCPHCGAEFATAGEKRFHREYRKAECHQRAIDQNRVGHQVKVVMRGNQYIESECDCGMGWSEDWSG